MSRASVLALVTVLIISIQGLCAQSAEPDKIVVIGSASIEVPADRVAIRISIGFSDKLNPMTAFELHRQAETKLVDLLHSSLVPDSLITYSLLSMSKRAEVPGMSTPIWIFETDQTVTVILTDITKYVPFYAGLVANGFNNFSADFHSSQAIQAQKGAIQKAVQQARSKAELMASAAGRKIKRVSKIADTEETEPPIARYYEHISQRARYANSSVRSELSSIPQTVSVDKQVKVVFELDN
jgi:uncharacterized protein